MTTINTSESPSQTLTRSQPEVIVSETTQPVVASPQPPKPKSERRKLLIGLGAIGLGLLIVIGITLAAVIILKPKATAPVEDPVKKKTVEQINVLPGEDRSIHRIEICTGRNITHQDIIR